MVALILAAAFAPAQPAHARPRRGSAPEPSATAAVALDPRDRAPGAPSLQTDTGYLRHAKRTALRDATGVLDVLVSYRKDQTSGPEELEFFAKLDGSTTAVRACADLEPRPAAEGNGRKTRETPRTAQVCGLRLIGWSGEAATGHVEFLAAGARKWRGAAWYQVILDPASDERGWLKAPLPDPLETSSVYRYLSLEEWIRSTGRVSIPARLKGYVRLQQSPYEDAELTQRQLRDSPGDLTLTLLGVQGDWAQVQQEENGCRGEEEGLERDPERRSDAGVPCLAGWFRWRAEGGDLLAFP